MNSTILINSDIHLLNLNKSKLKAVTRTSTLFSGFAMVALVEMSIEINNDLTSDIPALVLHMFTIVTCLLIGVHLLALMISTCLLPHIETVDLKNPSTLATMQYSNRASSLIIDNSKNLTPPKLPTQQQQQQTMMVDNQTCFINLPLLQPPKQHQQANHIKYDNPFYRELPLSKFQPYIELSWILSNGVGIVLFLIQAALICYIKFSPMFNSKSVYISGWIIIAIILIIFALFSFKFYKLLIYYNLMSKQNDIEMLNKEFSNLNNLSKTKNFKVISKKKLTLFRQASLDISSKSGNKKKMKYPHLNSFLSANKMSISPKSSV